MAAKRFNIDTEELWDCKGIPRPIRFPYSKYRAFGGQFGDDVKSSGNDRKVLYRQSKQNSATKSGLDCYVSTRMSVHYAGNNRQQFT